MATCDAAELLAASKCFADKTAGQLQIINAVLLCRQLQAINPMASCDPQELLSAGKCFVPYTGGMLQIIITQLLCEILNGGTAEACIYPVDDVPVIVSACDGALAYGTRGSPVAGKFWQYDAASGEWDILIDNQ